MKIPSFLKKKTTYVILVILIVGVALYLRSSAGSKVPQYETAPVQRGALAQTVEVTGEITPAARIDLSFKTSGTVNKLNVKIGDVVKTGDVLAELKNDDVVFAARNASAALAVAQANLNAKLAGETPQSIKIAQTQVEQAQASYNKAIADLAASKLTTADSLRVAQLALQTAQHNLDNQNATVSQTVQNAYDSARTTLLTAIGPLQTGLADGDAISGVDNTAANQTYLNVLGFLDSGSLQNAKNSYVLAKTSKLSAEQTIKSLNAASSKDAILNAANALETAIALVQSYLTDVQKVLSASLTSSNLTATDLASKKATIDGDRVSVSAQNSSVLTAIQSVKNAELSKTQVVQQLQDAFDTAQTNLNSAQTNAITQVKTAETTLAIQKASLDAAQATFDQKNSGPRPVDVAGLRASVQQAAVAADKAANDLKDAQIIAPVDGTVADVIPSIGEQVTQTAVVVKMVGTTQYDIEAQVPEADIAKVKVGDNTTITLDAFGDSVPFSGTVTAEDPDQTKVQDAVYYKIRVNIDPAGHDIKPGMTANVTIKTAEAQNALIIPLRAVRTATDGTKTVRVLKGTTPEDRTIVLGLYGDEGRVEVTSGLTEGEAVIVSETGTTTP